MIRFLNLKNQICEGQNDFAFFDTVSGTICSFGEQGEQVFSSVGEFQYAYGKGQGGTTRPLARFLSLIPKDYFGNESQPSYSGAVIAGSGKLACPKCHDRGWLYDDLGNRAGTCSCHY
jgi:hypothetical protein